MLVAHVDARVDAQGCGVEAPLVVVEALCGCRGRKGCMEREECRARGVGWGRDLGTGQGVGREWCREGVVCRG